MKSFLIDTNCLLSFVTDRNPSQLEKISAVIEEAARLNLVLYILPNVISEFVYVLQNVYEKDDLVIVGMLRDLHATPGIELRSSFELDGILEIWPQPVKDYGDAVLAAASETLRIPVLTFDRDFAKQLKKANITCELLS
jgi:predicted nucleic acid-binding protein